MKKHIFVAFSMCLLAAATIMFSQLKKDRMTLINENIEALSDDEATPIKQCYVLSSFATDWVYAIPCNPNSTESAMYDCPPEDFVRKATIFYCIDK